MDKPSLERYLINALCLQAQKCEPQKPRGCPKGSKNQNKEEVTLNAELQRILAQAKVLLIL